MIKLISLIKELGINKPIHHCKSDDELMRYLNSKPDIKSEFIRLVLTEMEVIDIPSWDYVIRGWNRYEIKFDNSNGEEEDEVLILDNEEEDILYFTIDPDKKFLMYLPKNLKINLGPNTIYFKFY